MYDANILRQILFELGLMLTLANNSGLRYMLDIVSVVSWS